jgi:hypothetical protein
VEVTCPKCKKKFTAKSDFDPMFEIILDVPIYEHYTCPFFGEIFY